METLNSRLKDISERVDRILLDTYSPPDVLANSSMQILRSVGRTSPFLKLSRSETTQNLLEMVREGLMPELYVALEEVKNRRTRIEKRKFTFVQQSETSIVYVSVIPIHDTDLGEAFFLVLFEESNASSSPQSVDFSEQLGANDIDSSELTIGRASAEQVVHRYQASLEEAQALAHLGNAEDIIIGIKRAADLTAQLLAFARKGKYLMVSVDIHHIVGEVANLLSHSINKRITIQKRLNARLSKVIGDPTQLQNAVLNLALNARDAMPNGGVLTLATEVVELDKSFCNSQSFNISPGYYTTVCVSDTGVGMKEEILQRIFEPFFTTKEAGEGSGMGLAAVYGTARSHKGAIIVSSKLGHGSTFRLYLPVSDAEDKHSEPEPEPDQQHVVEKTARILLVEDDDKLRKVLALLLEGLGNTVSVCSNGSEAIELYRKDWRSIDLVILDIVMPIMGGRETFIALREICPDVLVLLLSGYSLDGEAQSIMNEGAQGFIQKPFRAEQLSSQIFELLHSKRKQISPKIYHKELKISAFDAIPATFVDIQEKPIKYSSPIFCIKIGHTESGTSFAYCVQRNRAVGIAEHLARRIVDRLQLTI